MSGKENDTPRRELTNDQRSEIIGAYKCGVKGCDIAQYLGHPTSTIYDIINRFNKTGSPHPQYHSGHPKMLTERDERSLVCLTNINQDATLSDITGEFRTTVGMPISTKTIGKYLNNLG